MNPHSIKWKKVNLVPFIGCSIEYVIRALVICKVPFLNLTPPHISVFFKCPLSKPLNDLPMDSLKILFCIADCEIVPPPPKKWVYFA